MKLLILIGMVIIFISAFFTLFIFDTVIKSNLRCLADSDAEGCNDGVTSTPVVFGFVMIAFFIVIDALVIYVIMKSISADDSTFSSYPSWSQKQ